MNSSVMLTIGNTYARGKVVGIRIDADGNSVGRTNNNPILDTRKYRDEVDNGEVSKLTGNFIAKSVYAACDDSGNG